ncbi:MAG TPA: hypothetical protein VH519_05485 [Hyphomicrobiaceae bacterium]|jgi:hypothetical protein
MTMPATTPRSPRPLLRHSERPNIPRIPYTTYLRELTLPDGRKMTVDKRNIGFLCQGKVEEFGGKAVVIIGWRGWAKPVPVVEAYDDVKGWWRFDPSANRSPR